MSRKVASLVVVFAAVAQAKHFEVRKDSDGNFRVVSEDEVRLPGFSNPNTVAKGEYNHTMLQIGWDVEHITTNPAHSDLDQAYAAGYFEGTQTFEKAYNHYYNQLSGKDGATKIPEYVETFFSNHMAWLEKEFHHRNATKTMTPYWTQLSYIWRQWNGMYDGMAHVAPKKQMFSKAKLITLTSMGDLFDVIPGANPNRTKGAEPWRNMTKNQFTMWMGRNSHCTSLYKLTADMEDIFFGHVAWYNFNSMMRIFKQYTFNFKNGGTNAKTISMSSYPGMVSSFDDFYVMDSGFSTIETSLMVYNQSMYDGNIRPDLLLYWERVMVANRMATSAPDWAEKVAYLNSGTYNNQWMILDMNLFTPGQDLLPNTMWVAEQYPGVVKSQDVTEFLRYGYYPSYNVPMNKELWYAAGYGEACKKPGGPEMSDYEMCVRAQIFRRDQGKVHDLESYKHQMQYNDYEVDPISAGNPMYAISARADLPPLNQCFGAFDAKVSSYKLFKQGQIVHSYSGPTPQQPRFGYNITSAKCPPHRGLPEVYNFDWVIQKP